MRVWFIIVTTLHHSQRDLTAANNYSQKTRIFLCRFSRCAFCPSDIAREKCCTPKIKKANFNDFICRWTIINANIECCFHLVIEVIKLSSRNVCVLYIFIKSSVIKQDCRKFVLFVIIILYNHINENILSKTWSGIVRQSILNDFRSASTPYWQVLVLCLLIRYIDRYSYWFRLLF